MPRSASGLRWVAALGALPMAVALGCAAAAPQLVETRTPTPGELRLTIGGAALAPVAGDVRALDDARAAQGSTASGAASTRAAAVADAAIAQPGIAPVVRVELGAAPRLSASLRYGGRDLGVAGRFVLAESRGEQGGATTVSIGLEARTLLKGRPAEGVLPADVVASGVRGVGATLPLVLAWSSDAGLVSAYASGQLGFDLARASVSGALVGDASVRRWFGAFTLGLGVGFRRVRAIVELGLERDWVRGDVAGSAVALDLWSLTPGFAISTRI